MLDESYNIELSAKTLKSKPTYGNLDCIINKKDGKFTLQLKDIEDPDNGIESYHYEIYDIRDDNEPVAIYDKTSKGSIDIDVNKKENIKRNQTYYYVVVLDFYDNEKYYEYSTTKSQYFKMTGVQGPTMSFETDTVTFERITGTITIDDPYRTIDYSKDMTIQYVNSIGTTKSFKVSGATTIPFDADTLRASDTYIISVFATVDLQDDNDPDYDGVILYYYIDDEHTLDYGYYNEDLLLDPEWQEVSLDYFFSGTLEEYDSATFYVEYYCEDNGAVGRQFFVQYPSEEVITRCAVMDDYGEVQNIKVLKMWESFKSNSLPLWAVILLIVEVAVILFGVTYYFVSKHIKKQLRIKRQSDK